MSKVINLYEKHIKGMSKGDLTVESEAFVTNVKTSIRKTLKIKSSKVYITARSLKHIYDVYI